jgi:hypothetical protein
MTCTDASSVELARELGAERIVLARELSTVEIATIVAQTDAEVEVFVHGALCVAYSGQCLTSEAIGGRSANRGACAQACRLPYTLIVDGQPMDLADRAYLLSPEDLEAARIEQRKGRTRLVVALTADLSRGDGILVEGGFAGQGELGGRVWDLEVAGQDALHAGRGDVASVWLGPDLPSRPTWAVATPYFTRARRAPFSSCPSSCARAWHATASSSCANRPVTCAASSARIEGRSPPPRRRARSGASSGRTAATVSSEAR